MIFDFAFALIFAFFFAKGKIKLLYCSVTWLGWPKISLIPFVLVTGWNYTLSSVCCFVLNRWLRRISFPCWGS